MLKSFAHTKRYGRALGPTACQMELHDEIELIANVNSRVYNCWFLDWSDLRVSGLWLLTPPATVMGALGTTLILIAFVWPVLKGISKPRYG